MDALFCIGSFVAYTIKRNCKSICSTKWELSTTSEMKETPKKGIDSICRHPLIYMWELNWGSLRHKFGKNL